MDLPRLHAAGAHVQHEDVLGLRAGEEARRTAQDTSEHGYVAQKILGTGEVDRPAKETVYNGCPLFTRMTLVQWKQDVCPEFSSSGDRFEVLPPHAVAVIRSKQLHKRLD